MGRRGEKKLSRIEKRNLKGTWNRKEDKALCSWLFLY